MVGKSGNTGAGTGKSAAASRSSSAGAKHGSNASTDKTDTPSGLNENTGEFRVGEKIIFGTRNGNILIRHSPQGDEVEVGEATLAGLMVDAFFTDKFGAGDKAEYPTVQGSPR